MTAPPVRLTAAVRERVVAQAADALGRLDAALVPGPLRRVASFAQARRARLGASAIASVLASDDQFRERVADGIRTSSPELVELMESGRSPAAADPVEVAAAAYLMRPEGWQRLLASAQEQIESEARSLENTVLDDAVARANEQLRQVQASARDTREKARAQVSDLKRTNADLRRQLAEAQSAAARTQKSVRDAIDSEAAARRAAERKVTAGEAELRRLRARLAEVDAELADLRRAGRETKDAGTARARLLLDTLLEAVQGLRRELALPPIETLPADTVSTVEPTRPSMPSAARSLPAHDTAVWDELLALPQVHVIVDGYNVSIQAWPTSPLEAQRNRLAQALASLVAGTVAEVTIVFDGAELDRQPAVRTPRGVRVRFSPPGVIADEVIRQMVAAEPGGRPIVVVSSDREVADAVTALGARAVPSSLLVRRLAGN